MYQRDTRAVQSGPTIKRVAICTLVMIALSLPICAALAHHQKLYIPSGVTCTTYDGASDDLLTAGLGKNGLQGAVPPIAVPTSPTGAELRRLAIYNNYRALADTTTNGGYGVLFGPNIDLDGNDTLGEGKIAGTECITFAGGSDASVTMMVQIPSNFDSHNACIVAAPSSGSRGVYGAIGTTGEWGLKRGCAVAYTDKGTGNGAHDLQNDTVNLINGVRVDASTAGRASNFTARLTAAERAAFATSFPHRFAYKHAHSERNPEKDWGSDVLQSIRFAKTLLIDRIGGRGTMVIASSVSNGGGASLAAAELDLAGLIDGIVVSEPQVQPKAIPELTIKRGSRIISNHGKGLYDYITLANLYQPCAALAASNAESPLPDLFVPARGSARCAALYANDLLAADILDKQAEEAQGLLNRNGWEPESNLLNLSHYGLQIAPAVSTTYANAYGRFRVVDNLCGLSMGSTPGPVDAKSVAQIFGTGNGVPPTSGINLINNISIGGPVLDPASISPSTGVADYNFDGALCLRRLFTQHTANANRVRTGIAEVTRNGSLHGKPAIIVHGRADNLVPVNHASRPYYGLNKMVEGHHSNLRYYEVTNAQHFEAFLPWKGYDTRFVPLHVYGVQALNMMYAHLKNGTPLAPSQVVRTTPRGGNPGSAPPITPANVPPISQTPAAADTITFSAETLVVPD
jgi:hydroxybutyrate-dimer hydrolase